MDVNAFELPKLSEYNKEHDESKKWNRDLDAQVSRKQIKYKQQTTTTKIDERRDHKTMRERSRIEKKVKKGVYWIHGMNFIFELQDEHE